MVIIILFDSLIILLMPHMNYLLMAYIRALMVHMSYLLILIIAFYVIVVYLYSSPMT